RGCRPSCRRARRGPACCLPGGARPLAPRLPCLRAQLLVGEQRATVHRPSAEARGGPCGARHLVHGPGLRLAHEETCAREEKEERLMTDTSFHALDKETITKAYARWAPVYDLVFGAVFERGREAAIAAAERIGGRILEVGVGTGISLPDYAP